MSSSASEGYPLILPSSLIGTFSESESDTADASTHAYRSSLPLPSLRFVLFRFLPSSAAPLKHPGQFAGIGAAVAFVPFALLLPCARVVARGASFCRTEARRASRGVGRLRIARSVASLRCGQCLASLPPQSVARLAHGCSHAQVGAALVASTRRRWIRWRPVTMLAPLTLLLCCVDVAFLTCPVFEGQRCFVFVLFSNAHFGISVFGSGVVGHGCVSFAGCHGFLLRGDYCVRNGLFADPVSRRRAFGCTTHA